MLNNLNLKNQLNLDINFDLRSPNTIDGKYPLVIFSHGFKSYRNWGFIPFLCEKLSKNYITVNFDFSLNGVIDQEKVVFDSEIFRKNTVTQQISDLNLLIDYLVEILTPTTYFNGEIILLGHSLGGATSTILTKTRKDINKIILLASISQINRNTDRQKDLWRQTGYMELTAQPNNQKLYLDYTYQNDKDINFTKNEIIENVISFQNPMLIVHGNQDFTVKLNEAEDIYNSRINAGLKDITKLLILEKCNHTFNVKLKDSYSVENSDNNHENNRKKHLENNLILKELIENLEVFLQTNEIK